MSRCSLPCGRFVLQTGAGGRGGGRGLGEGKIPAPPYRCPASAGAGARRWMRCPAPSLLSPRPSSSPAAAAAPGRRRVPLRIRSASAPPRWGRPQVSGGSPLPCPAGPRRLRGRGAAPGPSLHCLRLLAFIRGLAFGGAEGPRWQRGGRVPHPRSSRLSPSQRLALQRWVRRGGTWKPVTCFFWGAGAKLQRAVCMLKPPQLALLEVNVICSCRRDEGKRDAVRWGSSFEVTEAVAVPMEVKPNLILGPPCCVTAVRFPAKALTFG